MNNYDVVIIGAGPAGIFTALEMIRNGSKKRLLLLRKEDLLKKEVVLKLKQKSV